VCVGCSAEASIVPATGAFVRGDRPLSIDLGPRLPQLIGQDSSHQRFVDRDFQAADAFGKCSRRECYYGSALHEAAGQRVPAFRACVASWNYFSLRADLRLDLAVGPPEIATAVGRQTGKST
jgi:hypothetical protein